MFGGGLSTKDAAKILGCSVEYFNNKMHRNSFSFEDIVKMSDAAGFTICFKNNTVSEVGFDVDPNLYISME